MRIRPAGFFVLRSPILPYDELSAWSDGLKAPRALASAPDDTSANPEASLEAALTEDRLTLRTRLQALIERPEIREALFLASPDLHERLPSWRGAPDGRRGQRIEWAVVRYLERMAARSTPFGLFAGCAVGRIGSDGDRTRLVLAPRTAYRRHTRLDMHYVCGLIHALEADEAIRTALRYAPTTSLYRLAERWHWVELTPDDPAHSHRYHRLDASPALDELLARAQRGVVLAELEASAAFSSTMLDRRLFVSELESAVTGPEPIHVLIERLEAMAVMSQTVADARAALHAVRDEIAALDADGLGADLERYESVVTRLRALPGPVDPAKLWQAELIRTPDGPAESASLVLGQNIVAEFERGVRILHRLHRPRRDHLSRFREAFVSRYEGVEARRAVPLAEALDPELGLGFGSSTGHDGSLSLLEGLDLPQRTDDPSVPLGGRHAFLFRKLAEAQATGAQEIVLDDADLERLANPNPPPLPDAFSVTGALVAESAQAVTDGEFQVLLTGIAGPSGARLAGRFCHGDPVLHEQVVAYLRAEEALRPDVLFAEIAHLPEPRAGNVIHRPVLRDYEITYLATSGVPQDRQIPLSDLLVSVEGERVVLRSVRLGREVVPRLTCAQNYFHVRTTHAYRFLAALQDQGVASGLGWDWGPLALAPFLPRVRCGRVALTRARWRLDKDETRALDGLTGAALFGLVNAWRTRRGVPRHARLADDDNELLIDFDNIVSVESFAQLVRGRDSAALVEAYPGPDELGVCGPEGRYFHELSIPYLGSGFLGSDFRTDDLMVATSPAPGEVVAPVPRATDSHPLRSETRNPRPSTIRAFPPGSAWLYAKLYAAPSVVDSLLRRVVRPIIDRAFSAGAADGWFFIRYGDPGWHLRLRFRGDPDRLFGQVAPLLSDAVAPLLERGEVRRLQFDTYEREVERYGGPVGVIICEQVFEADSTAVLEIVEALDDATLTDARWRLAAAGMDQVLNGLGLGLERKLDVVRGARDAFAREHRADPKLLRQIGERFRVERASLEDALDLQTATAGPWAGAAATLQRLGQRVTSGAAQLHAAADRDELTLPLVQIAPSLLHMHANRLLRSDHRRQELVLYDFLARLYDAQVARARTSEATTQ